MDFVSFEEAWSSLKNQGLTKLEGSTEEEFRPGLDDHDDLVIFDLCGKTPDADSIALEIPKTRAADALEAILHKLHLAPVLLFPIGRWRHVFDAIAFELTENETWQDLHSTAIIELNTHDPLLCEPGDMHTVHDVLVAVLSKSETAKQGVVVAAIGKPFLIVVEPADHVRIELMTESLAEEVRELIEPFVKTSS